MIKRRYFYRCKREHQDGRGFSDVCGTFFTRSFFQMNEIELFRHAIKLAEDSDTFLAKPSDKPTFITALNQI